MKSAGLAMTTTTTAADMDDWMPWRAGQGKLNFGGKHTFMP